MTEQVFTYKYAIGYDAASGADGRIVTLQLLVGDPVSVQTSADSLHSIFTYPILHAAGTYQITDASGSIVRSDNIVSLADSGTPKENFFVYERPTMLGPRVMEYFGQGGVSFRIDNAIDSSDGAGRVSYQQTGTGTDGYPIYKEVGSNNNSSTTEVDPSSAVAWESYLKVAGRLSAEELEALAAGLQLSNIPGEPSRLVKVGNGLPFVELFEVVRDDLAAVRVTLARDDAAIDGEVRLELLRARSRPHQHASPEQELLACVTLAGTQLVRDEPVDLLVEQGSVATGDQLELRITVNLIGATRTIALKISAGHDRMAGHLEARVGADAYRYFGLAGTALYLPLEPAGPIPERILYSPVTQCNLNCVHCISAHTRKSVDRLPEQVKDKMVDWARSGQLKSLNTDYSGDILWADHRYGGEIDHLIFLDIPFQIDTNGVHLNEETIGILCQSKVSNVNISLDAACDATFRSIRRGAPPLAQVLAGIALLVEERRKGKLKFGITLGFSLMQSNLAEWSDFVSLGHRLGVDAINVSLMHAYTAKMEGESVWHDRETYNSLRLEAIKLAKTLDMPMAATPILHNVPEEGHRFCQEPWGSAVLLGNGDVAACCVPGTVMGNIHESTMEEIWHGARYKALRATVNSSRPPSPCSICPMHRRAGNAGSFLQFSSRGDGARVDGPFLIEVPYP
jgi:sulfatase maturation enzyme AslB (radical SAM superfamily)